MATDDKVKITLVEFAALRTEINMRLQSQSQTFAYVIAVLGGLISIVAAIRSTTGVLDRVNIGLLALCVPMLWAPIAMIFFDNEMMIFSIGAHISQYVLPTLRHNEPDAFRSDPIAAQSAIVSLTHFVASTARWVVLVVPAGISLAVGARTFEGSRILTTVLISVDGVLLMALLLATAVVIYMQLQWRWPNHWARWTRT